MERGVALDRATDRRHDRGQGGRRHVRAAPPRRRAVRPTAAAPAADRPGDPPRARGRALQPLLGAPRDPRPDARAGRRAHPRGPRVALPLGRDRRHAGAGSGAASGCARGSTRSWGAASRPSGTRGGRSRSSRPGARPPRTGTGRPSTRRWRGRHSSPATPPRGPPGRRARRELAAALADADDREVDRARPGDAAGIAAGHGLARRARRRGRACAVALGPRRAGTFADVAGRYGNHPLTGRHRASASTMTSRHPQVTAAAACRAERRRLVGATLPDSRADRSGGSWPATGRPRRSGTVCREPPRGGAAEHAGPGRRARRHRRVRARHQALRPARAEARRRRAPSTTSRSRCRPGRSASSSGPSGCGKTTSLKMVNRLIEPTAGRILIDGADAAARDLTELRRGIGYVIQQVGLFPHETIAENVATVPRLLGWPAAAASRAGRGAARRSSGSTRRPTRARYPVQLSGGERQRVGRRPGARRRPADHAHGRAVRGRRPDRPGAAPGRVPAPPGDRSPRRSSSSPTTSTRRSRWATSSPSSPTAASWPSSGRRPRSWPARHRRSSPASSAATAASSA